MANPELDPLEQYKDGSRHHRLKKEIEANKSRSRERWILLSKAVKSKRYQLLESNGSTSVALSESDEPKTYGLMEYSLAANGCTESDPKWVCAEWSPHCKVEYENADVKLYLRFGDNRLTFEELAGFDNSGNIRLWPCEELLAYLFAYGILKDKIHGTVICELGAGMTALAGLVIGSLSLHSRIYLTDGNPRCVANIEAIVKRNFSNPAESGINVQQLRWGRRDDYGQLLHKMENIICADCLFATKSHGDLLDTFDDLLVKPATTTTSAQVVAHTGAVFMLAPARGNSMSTFVTLVHTDGRFAVKVFEHYNQLFTRHYQTIASAASTKSFDSDSYFPYLLVLKRAKAESC